MVEFGDVGENLSMLWKRAKDNTLEGRVLQFADVLIDWIMY